MEINKLYCLAVNGKKIQHIVDIVNHYDRYHWIFITSKIYTWQMGIEAVPKHLL